MASLEVRLFGRLYALLCCLPLNSAEWGSPPSLLSSPTALCWWRLNFGGTPTLELNSSSPNLHLSACFITECQLLSSVQSNLRLRCRQSLKNTKTFIKMVKDRSKSGRMYVKKRDGREEPIHFDKITSRIQKLCYGLDMDYIDPPAITLKVINGLYSGVTTLELDNLAAEIAATMTTKHPDYATLAARY